MKGILKTILQMIIPLAEAQGLSMEAQDADDTGTDDLIGEGLVFLGKFAQFLLDKSNGKPAVAPSIPDALS